MVAASRTRVAIPVLAAYLSSCTVEIAQELVLTVPCFFAVNTSIYETAEHVPSMLSYRLLPPAPPLSAVSLFTQK